MRLLVRSKNGSSKGGIPMLRPHVPEAYLWIILWFVLALLLLIAEATLLSQPAIAIVNQVKEVLDIFFLQASQFI
jgi:hypothetical protein